MQPSHTALLSFCSELEKIAVAVNPQMFQLGATTGRIAANPNVIRGGQVAAAGAAGAAGLGAAAGGKDNRMSGAAGGALGGAAGAAAGAVGGAAVGKRIGQAGGRRVAGEARKKVPFLGRMLYGRRIKQGLDMLPRTHGVAGKVVGGLVGAAGLGAAGALAGGAAARNKKKKKGVTLTLGSED